jgi:hypothetical protein
VEPRCSSQSSAVLSAYEISVRLWAPTRNYPRPFSVRESDCYARNRGMNTNFEIPRKISKCPSKFRRNFVSAVGSSAANLCCFWCHSRWFLGVWKIILGVRPVERCSGALLHIMKALIIQFHRSSHYFVSFGSKCFQHFISVILLLGWVTELRFIKRKG